MELDRQTLTSSQVTNVQQEIFSETNQMMRQELGDENEDDRSLARMVSAIIQHPWVADEQDEVHRLDQELHTELDLFCREHFPAETLDGELPVEETLQPSENIIELKPVPVEIQPLPESHTAQEATSAAWKEEAQQCTRDHRCLLQ
jgi:hypothetical protein